MSRCPEGRGGGGPNQNEPQKQPLVWVPLTVPCPWAPECLATPLGVIIYIYVCVCVCVWIDRETESERQRARESV